MTNAFGGLKKAMETMINSLKETEKEVNTTEVKQVKELLKKYDIVLKDDIDEKELILKYETFYDQLNEFVIKKRKEIVDVEEMLNALSGIENVGNFSLIVNKKKENTNQIIDCDNRIVERIRQLETIIYNNRMKELDNMKTERYCELKQVEVQQIKLVDNEMDIINNSMNVLKQWSNTKTYNILFDSKVDGDGSNNVLCDKVLNKSNLYFITFDGNNNVFGGYVSVNINKSNYYYVDNNAFVFSLIRDGNVKNRKYTIHPRWSGSAFYFNNNEDNWLYRFGDDSWLYRFGDDIWVYRIGDNKSSWQSNFYNYNDEENPLIDRIPHLRTNFEAKRIIVIEMN